MMCGKFKVNTCVFGKGANTKISINKDMGAAYWRATCQQDACRQAYASVSRLKKARFMKGMLIDTCVKC